MAKDRDIVLKVLTKLPRLDCGHCDHPTCIEFSKLIASGKAKVSDCWILQQKQEVSIKMEDEKIHLHPFVQDFIRNTVLGMLKSLKHADVKGDEYLLINIQKRHPPLKNR